MSSNVFFPILIVAVCALVALSVYSSTRPKAKQKIFRLAVPRKKRLKLHKPEATHQNEPEENSSQIGQLIKWHERHENTLLAFFEAADKIMTRNDEGTSEKLLVLDQLPRIQEASESHPAPEIGAELTAVVGILNTGCASLSREDIGAFEEQRLLYIDYRSMWLVRIRQYVQDFERLVSLRQPLP